MKAMTILLATLISTSSFATTLKIPFLIEKKGEVVSAAQLNMEFKIQGPNKLPEVFSIDFSKQSIAAAEKALEAANVKLDELAEKYKMHLFMAGSHPGEVSTKDFKTCYTGKPAEAVAIAANLADSFYSDQLGFWGWRYKNEVNLEADDEASEANELLNESSMDWREWKGKDESILIISHIGDDGDDMLPGLIVQCK